MRTFQTFGKDASLIFGLIRTSLAPRSRRWKLRARGARRTALFALVMFGVTATAAAQDAITLPRTDESAPVEVAADAAEHWQQGVYDVWHLRGNCHVLQGETEIQGPEAVLWIDRGSPVHSDEPAKVLAYFEGGPQQVVTLAHAATKTNPHGDRLETPSWFGRLTTRRAIDFKLPTAQGAPASLPPIVARGLARIGPQSHVVNMPIGAETAIEQAQFTQAVPAPTPLIPAGAAPFRRLRVLQRSDLGYQIKTLQAPSGENVIVVSGGVNVIIEGLSVNGLPASFGPLGTVDIETDRAVIWTGALPGGDVGQVTQQNDSPLEIYMEGNIVFRQGDRVVYADRMFYDARRQIGTILNAELLAPPPAVAGYQYQGLVRLKAAAVRQLDASRFVASDALLTTSRLEEPAYSFESQTILFTDRQQPLVDPYTGASGVDPATGEPAFVHDYSVESRSNFLYVSGVPVFYWPTIATTLDKPTFYVNNVRVRNDSIFGFQTLFELDAFQLLGYEAPRGVDWNLDLDYLSKRGLGFGTSVEYNRDSFFTLLGPTFGRADAWFISDHGLDNLGLGRRDIVPEKSFRGRVFANHRQKLVGGLLDDWTVQGEVGWLSDRTFLEEYYENEWDENKDQLTGVRLKRVIDNMSFSLEANGRLNDFFTQTQWLPRGDFYWLGESLFDDQTTFYSHTSAAYANIGIATPPSNPTLLSQWTLLPWEVDSLGSPTDAQGERFVTRNEIDYPLDMGPVKVVPYALGEFGHWGADLEGDSIQRLWGQLGVRASIPFWAVDPTIRDPLFNLNGLAHKVVFDAEASYADADQSFDEFPLYDEIDDDAIEEFRRRLFFAPIGSAALAGQFNPKFDPRYWAIRSGIQDDVTATSMELADDLTAVRFGMRQRLQTKRGAPGEERIVDWMTFDSNATWFPDPGRDNFGQDIGLIDYDWRWHIGDRFTILSDGAADTFGNGFKTVSLGGSLNRPMIGNAYLGFRAMDGPLTANLVLGSINYRMSQKWIGSANASIDLASSGNIGQSFSMTRIGESLIATVGASYDQSKDNIGLSFLVEPRFLPKLNVTRRTGIEIPPVGANGLE